MTPWSVVPAPVPSSLDAADAWALHGAAAVSAAADLETWGSTELTYSARFMLARLEEQRYATRVRLVAVGTPPDGRTGPDDVVGTAYLVMPTEGNTHLATADLVVHPAHRRRGVGTLLLGEVERLARTHGRSTIVVSSDQRGEPAEGTPGVIEPPTGSGRVDGSAAAAVFAARNGYRLEQAERYSVLDLPVRPDRLAELHTAARQKAGDDYRLHVWHDHVPDRWLDGFALLETRMSTAVPQGGLAFEEDPWDGPRVRRAEEAIAAAGHGYLTVAAERAADGQLVAFTMLEYPEDEPQVAFQQDTLVLPEHRGRRLGMLVKTAALAELARRRPDARRVHTWNAEENEHMLAINVALGFAPRGVGAMWQKHLSPAVA